MPSAALTINHFLCGLLVGAPHDVALHVGHREAVLVHLAANVTHTADVRKDLVGRRASGCRG